MFQDIRELAMYQRIPVKIWEKKERQGNELGISPGNVV